MESHSWKSQLCASCQLNTLVRKGTALVDGRLLFTHYNWICRRCKESTSTTPQLISTQANEDICKNFSYIKNTKGLIICHQNINSIRNKFDDVINFLVECKVDIIAYTESKLDLNRDKDGMYAVSGYNLIRSDPEIRNTFN